MLRNIKKHGYLLFLFLLMPSTSLHVQGVKTEPDIESTQQKFFLLLLFLPNVHESKIQILQVQKLRGAKRERSGHLTIQLFEYWHIMLTFQKVQGEYFMLLDS